MLRKVYIKYFLFLLLFLCLKNKLVFAQKINVTVKGNEAAIFLATTSLENNYTDYLSAFQAIQKAQQQLIQNGYLATSIDSIIFDENKNELSVFPYLGKQYKWATLTSTNIPNLVLQLAGFDEKKFINSPIQPKKLFSVYNTIITYFENNGYPFASLKLDSFSRENETISAVLTLDKGPLIKIDSIVLNEDANIHINYLQKYLGIEQGEIYNESKIKKIDKLLNENVFLNAPFPWKINFNIEKTQLNLFLKNKSANRADVLVGLLPSNKEIGDKFLLTGDIKLAFVNALSRGEQLTFNWQNLQYKSPRMNIDALYPYIFNSNISVSSNFEYYKKDSVFRNVQGELGLQYQFNASNYIKAFYNSASSRLLNINTALLISTKQLPENIDVSTKHFGLEGNYSTLDYLINPRKGFQIKVKGSAAIRNILENSIVTSTIDPSRNENFSYLYDSIKTTSFRYQLQSTFAYYFSLTKRIVLQTKMQNGIMYSAQPLFRNEIFQIGGFRLLRGFDEGSLFVNNYHLLTLEPRYLLSKNSYFFAFIDGGFYKQNYGIVKQQIIPYSGGLGMLFETKAGLFNISYAIGATSESEFRFKNSKIHFGYLNYF